MNSSPLFQNGIDSLRVGMRYYMLEEGQYAHKHAILTIFHSIELFLKEYLYRVHPILIYRNIDKKITDDSITVGIGEILPRLENLGTGIPDDEKEVLVAIQRRRNRIEHHRYDAQSEDEAIIGQALKFITFFVEEVLSHRLTDYLESDLVDEVRRRVHDYRELWSLAEFRLEKWLREQWPNWDWVEHSSPDEFTGTVQCPACRQDYMVIEYSDIPRCFFCNADIDAAECSECGESFFKSEGCRCKRA